MAHQKSINKKYSIIIIVKNDPKIEDTLKDLQKKISSDQCEIIVVDASGETLVPIQKKFPEVKWIHFKPSKRISIPEQRNVGVKQSVGDIIIFVDASCTVNADWFKELMKPLETEKEKIVSGSIWATDQNNIHNTQNTRNQNQKYLNEAPTMNLAFYREVYTKTGPFDETFNYGSDVDFVTRAIKLGYKVRYVPEAKLYHDWGTFKEEIKRSYRYGQARVNIYAKHRDKLKDLLGPDLITLIYPTFILFLPVALIWPYYLLFLGVPLLKNRAHRPLETTSLNMVYGFGILVKFLQKLTKRT